MQLRERFAYVRAAGPAVDYRREGRASRTLPPCVKMGESRLGEVFFTERYWHLDYRHGTHALEAALALDAVAAARLAPGLTPADVRDAVFLDIETTGLSGGTGTYAFLVGAGTFEGFAFRVRQFFLADLDGEAAMLDALAETLANRGPLVSFNGTSFDLPQLSTRFAMQRLPPLAPEATHVDLLFAARRLYGRRLESCRLATIERVLLGLQREGDVPSWQVPGIYFGYARGGAAARLDPLFEHNALDVLSLVALLAHVGLDAGGRAAGDAAHLLALARWDEARGDAPGAAALLRAAWEADDRGDAGAEAVRRLARQARRAGDWDECERMWRRDYASASTARRAVAAVELAKILEHRRRDFAGALRLTESAAALLASLPRYQRPLAPTAEALAHRAARLERRL